MKKNEKWIVGLDFTTMDMGILLYTQSLSALLDPEEIIFVNVQKEDMWNPYIGNERLNYDKIVKEEKRLILENKVEQFFETKSTTIQVKVLKGEPFSEMTELAERQCSDLVIVGKKRKSNGSGILSIRLSKALNSNFLLVPEYVKPKFENVLVSSDFSEYSALGLKQALELKHEVDGLEINIFNGFDLPSGYSKSGKSQNEFEAIMLENTEKVLDHWSRELGHSGQQILRSTENKSVTQLLLDTARDTDTNLIIMGSRGHSTASRILLGSHTWKLVRQNEDFPLLIVKKKGVQLSANDLIKEL